MAREEYESVGEVVFDLINPVLARLLAISCDHQWVIPAKREAVRRLLIGVDSAWTAYRNELYGGGFYPQFTDNQQTAADIAGEVQND